MGIFGNIFGNGTSPSLDSVKFDAARYHYQGEKDGARVWFLSEGGGVGLYFFQRPPDLPTNAASVAELRDSYATRSKGQATVVDCRVLTFGGVQGIWLIIKALNKEIGGATYVGSLTLPYRDFSFVIKIQCQEQGVTGMREAVLANEAFSKGTITIENDKPVLHDWSPDDEKFDERFPQHPLSRVRAELRHIASSVAIDSAINQLPRFELPRSNG